MTPEEEFEKWWAKMREANNSIGRDYAYFTEEWIKIAFHEALAIGRKNGLKEAIKISKTFLFCDNAIDAIRRRIEEL